MLLAQGNASVLPSRPPVGRRGMPCRDWVVGVVGRAAPEGPRALGSHLGS